MFKTIPKVHFKDHFKAIEEKKKAILIIVLSLLWCNTTFSYQDKTNNYIKLEEKKLNYNKSK